MGKVSRHEIEFKNTKKYKLFEVRIDTGSDLLNLAIYTFLIAATDFDEVVSIVKTAGYEIGSVKPVKGEIVVPLGERTR